MRRAPLDERGAVQLADVGMTFVVMIGVLALAPVFSAFTGMIAADADPVSKLLLSIVVPFLFIFVIFSVGRSAQRGG